MGCLSRTSCSNSVHACIFETQRVLSRTRGSDLLRCRSVPRKSTVLSFVHLKGCQMLSDPRAVMILAACLLPGLVVGVGRPPILAVDTQRLAARLVILLRGPPQVHQPAPTADERRCNRTSYAPSWLAASLRFHRPPVSAGHYVNVLLGHRKLLDAKGF